MASSPRTIAVTGSTGFVGRHIVRTLIADGCAVRGLVRDREKARRTLPAQGAEWVFGDIADQQAVARLVRGCDAVVHCIGIRRELPPEVTFAKQHIEATRSITEAAKQAGISRFIHISALGTRADAASDYHRSKFQAEAIIRGSGLDWTILRPSIIHGPDGEFMQMAKAWVLGRSAPWFVLPYFVRIAPPTGFPPVPKIESARVQPVHIDDVCAAVAASLRSDQSIGEIYPLGGTETLDWPTMLTTIRDALPITEKGKRPAPLPGVIGFVAAKAAEFIGLGAMLPFGPSEPLMAIEDSTCSTDKARDHLGWRPRAFTTSMRQYAAEV